MNICRFWSDFSCWAPAFAPAPEEADPIAEDPPVQVESAPALPACAAPLSLCEISSLAPLDVALPEDLNWDNVDDFIAYVERERDAALTDAAGAHEALFFLDGLLQNYGDEIGNQCMANPEECRAGAAEDYETTSMRASAQQESQAAEATILLWIFWRLLSLLRPSFQLSPTGGVEWTRLRNPLRIAMRGLQVLAQGDQWILDRLRYWFPQMAMILASELDDPVIRDSLFDLLQRSGQTEQERSQLTALVDRLRPIDWTDRNAARRAEIELLDAIHQHFFVVREDDVRYPFAFLDSQYYLSRAFLTKSLGTDLSPDYEAQYRNFLRLSRTAIIGRIVPRLDSQGNPARLSSDDIRYYSPDLQQRSGKRELQRMEAMSNVQMAQILMMESNEFDEPISRLQRVLQETSEDNLTTRGREELQATIELFRSLGLDQPSIALADLILPSHVRQRGEEVEITGSEERIRIWRALIDSRFINNEGRIQPDFNRLNQAAFTARLEQEGIREETARLVFQVLQRAFQQEDVAYIARLNTLIQQPNLSRADINQAMLQLIDFKERRLTDSIRYLERGLGIPFIPRGSRTRESAIRAVDQVAVRQSAGENLMQLAYGMKDAHEPCYLEIIQRALGHFNAVINMEETYTARFLSSLPPNDTAHSMPRHLRQLATSARIARAKLYITVIGEITEQPTPSVLSILQEILTEEERNTLSSGTASRTRVLEIQNRLLQLATQQLQDMLDQQFHYPSIEAQPASNGQPASPGFPANNPDLVRDQQRTDVRLAIAEGRARRAFNLREQNHRAEADTILTEVAAELRLILATPNPNPITRALANFWIGKIMVITAGDQDNIDTIEQQLADAQPFIQNAINENILHDSLLSSAYQTLGEIHQGRREMREARQDFARAEALNSQNYEARVNLADIDNQLGNYPTAMEEYTRLQNDIESRYCGHLLLRRVELGMLEARMRQGDNYSADNVQALETFIAQLLTDEPHGSFLIERASNALIEALSDNETRHPAILTLINRIEASDYYISPRGRAFLALTRAEVTAWLRDPDDHYHHRYDDARTALESIPAAVDELIGRDRELHARYDLIDAELDMRQHRRSRDIMLPDLANTVMASRDENLMRRLIFDRVEGLIYGKHFDQALEVMATLGADQRVTEAFTSHGQELALTRFRLDLRLKQADVRLWEITFHTLSRHNFNPILTELNTLYTEATALEASTPALAEYARMLQGDIRLRQGDIARYRWAQRNFRGSLTSYAEVTTITDRMEFRPKRQTILLARLALGRAQVYASRYSSEHHHERARASFTEALRLVNLLPEDSDERDNLLLEINLAAAQFYEQENRPVDQEQSLQAAYQAADRIQEGAIEPAVWQALREMGQRYSEQYGTTFRFEVQSLNGAGRDASDHEVRTVSEVRVALAAGSAPRLANASTGLTVQLVTDSNIDGSSNLTPYAGWFGSHRFGDLSFAYAAWVRLPFAEVGSGLRPHLRHRPLLMGELSLYDDDFLLTLSGGFDEAELVRSSTHISAEWNAWGSTERNSRWPLATQRLRVGVAADYYSSGSHPILAISLPTISYNIDIPGRRFRGLRVGINWALVMQTDWELMRQRGEEGADVNPVTFAFRGGIQALVNISRYLTGYADFSLQCSADYCSYDFTFGIRGFLPGRQTRRPHLEVE